MPPAMGEAIKFTLFIRPSDKRHTMAVSRRLHLLQDRGLHRDKTDGSDADDLIPFLDCCDQAVEMTPGVCHGTIETRTWEKCASRKRIPAATYEMKESSACCKLRIYELIDHEAPLNSSHSCAHAVEPYHRKKAIDSTPLNSIAKRKASSPSANSTAEGNHCSPLDFTAEEKQLPSIKLHQNEDFAAHY